MGMYSFIFMCLLNIHDTHICSLILVDDTRSQQKRVNQWDDGWAVLKRGGTPKSPSQWDIFLYHPWLNQWDFGINIYIYIYGSMGNVYIYPVLYILIHICPQPSSLL